MTRAADPVLDALWKRVLDRWEDESAHSCFLDYCQQQNCLVEAAVRYRGMSADRDRHESAEKKLKAVTLLAMSQLEATRSEPPDAARSRAPYAMAALMLLIAATLGLLAYLRS